MDFISVAGTAGISISDILSRLVSSLLRVAKERFLHEFETKGWGENCFDVLLSIMNTAVAQQLPPDRLKEKNEATKPRSKRLVSLESFLARYSNREDPYKYEWNNGAVEKKPRTMNRDQLKILQNLMRLFVRTKAYAAMGELLSEVDMLMQTIGRTRRADVAYMSGEQMQAAPKGELTVCSFVAEVISKNDQINEMEEKLAEYFDNGVQVAWVIFPKLKQVKVYHSIRDITVCFGDDVCSAAPALPDFEISVNDIFA
jgi:Uma2 family endonuclease